MKFADMYPKDRFYAAEFKGKPVTLTFRAKDPVTSELLGKGGPSEKTLPIWHFEETPKKLPAVVTNGVCARAIMQIVLGKVEGDESDNWGGHKITLYPAPDPSGMSDDGLCIRVKGSPELERKLVFNAQIGRSKKTFTLIPTGNGKPPANVDPVSGEVTADTYTATDPDRFTGTDDDLSTPFDDLPEDDIGFTDEAPHTEEAAPATQTAPGDDDTPADASPPAEASSGADGPIPGRGALFDADDPNRPATGRDKKALSEALAHAPAAWAKKYREQFNGRSNSELTHGEITKFTADAVKEANS